MRKKTKNIHKWKHDMFMVVYILTKHVRVVRNGLTY